MFISLIVLLNALASSVASVLLAPVAWLPGWLSLGLIATISGILMLMVFKHTSNQRAIKLARNQIKANLLALSLYKESVAVSLRAQGQILRAAGKLLLHSLVPMLVISLPTCLLLGQLAAWFQVRPLRIGEEAVVTVQLANSHANRIGDLKLEAASTINVSIGPVRVPTKHMVCWTVAAPEAGCCNLVFYVGDEQFTKEFVVGDGYQPASILRPAAIWSELLLHPRESPFPKDSVVQSIEIAYPSRPSWMAGSATWLPFWFIVSMVAALAAKPVLGVNI